MIPVTVSIDCGAYESNSAWHVISAVKAFAIVFLITIMVSHKVCLLNFTGYQKAIQNESRDIK